MTQLTPDALLLIPAYLLVAIAGFALCRHLGEGQKRACDGNSNDYW